MTYGHLQADCLYTGISSGPNARSRVWEAFTFYLTWTFCINQNVTVQLLCVVNTVSGHAHCVVNLELLQSCKYDIVVLEERLQQTDDFNLT